MNDELGAIVAYFKLLFNIYFEVLKISTATIVGRMTEILTEDFRNTKFSTKTFGLWALLM